MVWFDSSYFNDFIFYFQATSACVMTANCTVGSQDTCEGCVYGSVECYDILPPDGSATTPNVMVTTPGQQNTSPNGTLKLLKVVDSQGEEEGTEEQ